MDPHWHKHPRQSHHFECVGDTILREIHSRIDDLQRTFSTIFCFKDSEFRRLKLSLENLKASNEFLSAAFAEPLESTGYKELDETCPVERYEDTIRKQLFVLLKERIKTYKDSREEMKREAAMRVATDIVRDWKVVEEMLGEMERDEEAKGKQRRREIEIRRDLCC